MAEASRWHRGGEGFFKCKLLNKKFFSLVTFGMVNPHMYYLNKVMSSLFLDTSVPGEERTNFKSIRSVTDFWKVKYLVTVDEVDLGTQPPRPKQSSYLSLLKYFSVGLSHFTIILFMSNRWRYSTSNTNSPWHWGFLGVYRNGGYIFTLSKSKSETKNKFIDLRLNKFPATGGILTSWQFYSVKLLRYVSYYDYFIASCEITFCIFLFVFTTQEVKKIKEFKSAYFKSIWNWLELLLLLLCFVAVSFNTYCNVQIFLFLGQLLKSTEQYSDFYFLACWHIYYNNIIAITIFFAWIKNMFLAIINDTYSEVKADYSIGRRPDFELGKMIKQVSQISFLIKILRQISYSLSSCSSGDLAEQARREGFDENEVQKAEQMKIWKERLEKKYYSTEIQDDYQPVTQEEFRELFLYAVELEKELHYINLKLNQVMRKVSAL
uniref:Polycystin 2 like 2, transient receptor potential cation channel n=1 Tax=Rhinopithecus bieti TaxID=61621 RepID=A0A2K6MXJ0_RHIBE